MDGLLKFLQLKSIIFKLFLNELIAQLIIFISCFPKNKL